MSAGGPALTLMSKYSCGETSIIVTSEMTIIVSYQMILFG